MTDVTATTPLKLTINPLPQPAASTGRLVNANSTPGTIPNNPDFWGQGGLSFKSLLDTVNPLQHIPVVSTLYQAMTGDVPSSGSSLAGGALFGGPLGFAASLVGEIVKTQTGNTIGGNMLALLQGNGGAQTAQNSDDSSSSPYLSANQRAAYNAYVKASQLTQLS